MLSNKNWVVAYIGARICLTVVTYTYTFSQHHSRNTLSEILICHYVLLIIAIHLV